MYGHHNNLDVTPGFWDRDESTGIRCMITIITWVLPLCYCAADLSLCFCILKILFSHDVALMTSVISNPVFFIGENKVTDQLVQQRSAQAADQGIVSAVIVTKFFIQSL